MSYALVVQIRIKPENVALFMQKLAAEAVPLRAARERGFKTRVSH